MAPDPNLTPVRRDQETTRPDGGSEVTRKSTMTTPDQQSQQVSVVDTNDPSRMSKSSSVTGPSPAAAGAYVTKKRLFYAYNVIWYILAFVEIVLAFRFVLKMLGANPDSGFGSFIYGLSSPFAGPFATLFNASTGPGAKVTAQIEWSTLVAGVVYAIAAWGVVKLFKIGKPVTPEDVNQTVNMQ